MDLSTINDMIDEIERSETSLSNIRNLSALYNVKTHLVGSVKYDSVSKELNDILPSYKVYIDAKRDYQLNKTTEDNILLRLKNVCKEIEEFVQALYSNTDTQAERVIIDELKQKLK